MKSVFFIVIIGVVIGIILGATLLARLRSRLSIRIAILVFITGPAVLLALLLFNALYYGTIGEPAPWWSRIIQLLLVLLGMPLILGLLAARLVAQPLGEFMRIITLAKENKYQVKSELSGVHEFDRVLREFNDLTTRLNEEEILRKNLISDTSHELATPITALLGQLEGMKKGVIANDAEHIDQLLVQTYRLQDMTERLVEYARVQSRSYAVKIEEVTLDSLIDEIQRDLGEDFTATGVILKREIAKSPIKADRILLRQLLTNLIQNSLRYADATTITIRWDGTELRVADDGKGVPEKSIHHLFERFYRVDPSRSRQTGGLGIGLAIVKEIVLVHGWQLRAKNTKPGLTFYVTTNAFTQTSHGSALLRTMSTKQITQKQPFYMGIWLALAAIAVGLLLFGYTAVQQDYRQTADDPQIQMAEDAVRMLNSGAMPNHIVTSRPVDAAKSLAPFTIVVTKQLTVAASDVRLGGTTPLPPQGVFTTADRQGEIHFTWQTAGGERFAAVVDPYDNGYVLSARSLREVEKREQRLGIMAGVTLIGIIAVLAITFVIMR